MTEAIEKVVIDLSHAHLGDITAVRSQDKVVLKFRRAGSEVDIIGPHQASATLVDQFAMHNKPAADGHG